MFVGFSNDYLYDGAILGMSERRFRREVILCDVKKLSKKDKDALLKHGEARAVATPGVVESAGHTEDVSVVVYSSKLIVEILAQKLVDDGTAEDLDDARTQATEWHDFNTFTAWHGVNTPIFVEDRH